MAKKVERQLSIYINGNEVNRSLKSIGGEIAHLRNRQKKLTAGTDEWIQTTKELKKARNEYKLVNDEIREVEATLDDTTESGLGFISSLTGLFQSLKDGDLDGAKAGLDGIGNGIKGMTKQAIAFIATPIGAAIAALAAIAIAGKEWYDYNKQVQEVNNSISSFTGLVGQELDNTRVKVTALAETFDTEYMPLLEAAAPLAKQYGISMEEALDIVGQGMAEGGRANEEYLRSLREYPAFFAQAGFSATEFKDLINAGFDLKIYQDKLPDAIKEATLALTEQTSTTRDAMVNAFGAPFTDDILNRINTGETSIKDALGEIQKQAETSNISVQANAQLTADLFKGAGEDAGSATKIWEALNMTINGTGRELTALDEYYVNLTAANEELAAAQDRALKSDQFTAFSQQGELAWIKLKTGFFDVLDIAFTKFIELTRFNNKTLKQFFAVVGNGGKSAQLFKEAFINAFTSIVNVGSKAGSVFKSLLTFNPSEISKSVDQFKASYENLKNTASEDFNAIGNDVQAVWERTGNIMDAIYAKQDAAAAAANKAERDALKGTGTGNGNGKLGLNDEQKKIAQERMKTEQDLADFIIAKRKELEDNKLTGLEKELAAIDDKYAKELEKAAAHGDQLKEIELLKEQEKQLAKDELTRSYAEQSAALEDELRLEKEAQELQRLADQALKDEEAQQFLLEKARLLAQAEIDQARETELAKVQDVEGAEQLKAAIRAKYANKETALEEYTQAAKKDLKDKEVAINQATEDAKLGAVQGALGSIASLLNEGSTAWKALKIAEATIATFRSAQQAYSSVVGIPVVGPVLAPIAAATAAAAGAINIKKIASTKLKKIPKPSKYYGGYTESTPIMDDEYGGATGYYHANEWVSPAWMTQSPRYANTISWLENERKQGPSYTTTTTATPSGDNSSNQISSDEVNRRLLQHLDNGITTRTYIGYEEIEKMNKLNDDITQSRNNLTS